MRVKNNRDDPHVSDAFPVHGSIRAIASVKSLASQLQDLPGKAVAMALLINDDDAIDDDIVDAVGILMGVLKRRARGVWTMDP